MSDAAAGSASVNRNLQFGYICNRADLCCIRDSNISRPALPANNMQYYHPDS